MDVVESLAEMYYMFCEEGCAFLATGDGEWLKYEPSSGVATFGQWRGFHALPLRYVHPVTDF